MLKYIFTASVVVVVYSCTPALYQPLPEHATAGTTHEQLIEGRKLYVNSCGSCHTLYLPEMYPESVWRHNLDEMQERSKIDDHQKALILTYLTHGPGKK
jgi:hypothetical protein